ncbi:MAG: DUF4838 domain-containing protein [Verrucomicrobiales bacterium]|nr:DUF4838 domain-containing protein [Verrucomicrobiales bacterium]
MIRSALLLLLLLVGCVKADAQPFIVENGAARAEIIIPETPPRMVKLAAEELQLHLEKISDGRLPIVTSPTDRTPVRIYIGKSEGTEELGIDDTGLRYGAYRIVSGPNWLVLLGHDFDFTPVEPTSRQRNDQDRAQKEWDKLTADKTDAAWGFPMASTYRGFNRATETWANDEGGSLQAVYGFLRELGVRWYLPGNLGEIIPKQTTIPLPQMDEEVHPDFAVRQYLGPMYANAPKETVLWGRRIGLNYGYELLGVGPKTHGLSRVHAREEMKQAHPEYYALIGEKRNTTTKGTGHACWSEAGLEKEAIAYARTLFSHYGEPTLQLSPQDGLQMCRCDKCSELTPSDAVWGFLNRVAAGTRETHPDRFLVGAAYSSYRELPPNIDQLEPNIIVRINNVGRPRFRDEEHWQWYQDLVDGWKKKASSGKIIRVENNYYDTVIHPHAIARDIQAMKGISLGEMNEVAREYTPGRNGQTWGNPGTNHLNLYINARFLFDADQNIENVLSEYYRLFYGPAAEGMRKAFDYAESHYNTEGKAELRLPERVGLLELLHKARESTAEGSIYRKRIDLIVEEFDPLAELQDKLTSTRKRGDVPRFEYWNRANGKWDADRATAKVDGKLDERYWTLRGKLSGSEKPERFQILLGADSLWIGVRCFDDPESPGAAGETDLDADSILDGERIEILLETDAHAFYQIAVTPQGGIYDADVIGENGKRWNSNAEVAVAREPGGWTLEARIPLIPEMEGAGDPLHHILYRRHPTKLWPWYFNIVRIRGEKTSAFIPVSREERLDPFTFGKLAR